MVTQPNDPSAELLAAIRTKLDEVRPNWGHDRTGYGIWSHDINWMFATITDLLRIATQAEQRPSYDARVRELQQAIDRATQAEAALAESISHLELSQSDYHSLKEAFDKTEAALATANVRADEEARKYEWWKRQWALSSAAEQRAILTETQLISVKSALLDRQRAAHNYGIGWARDTDRSPSHSDPLETCQSFGCVNARRAFYDIPT